MVFHSYALTERRTDEPLWRVIPELNFGALGVGCFFVISGFLVTQSWLARTAVVPFVAARVCASTPRSFRPTLFTVALAGSRARWPGAPSSAIRRRSTTPARRPGMGDGVPLPAHSRQPFPHDVNGSLWTLPMELRLYVAVLVGGVLGARAPVLAAAVAALVALFAAARTGFRWPRRRVVRDSRCCSRWDRSLMRGATGFRCRSPAPRSPCARRVESRRLARGALFAPLLAYSCWSRPTIRCAVAARSIAPATIVRRLRLFFSDPADAA